MIDTITQENCSVTDPVVRGEALVIFAYTPVGRFEFRVQSAAGDLHLHANPRPDSTETQDRAAEKEARELVAGVIRRHRRTIEEHFRRREA